VIAEDRNGNLWIGAFNGLWKYNPNDEKSIPTQIVKTITIRDIYIDKNSLLLGTSKGLQTLDLSTESMSPVVFENTPSNLVVRSIYKIDLFGSGL